MAFRFRIMENDFLRETTIGYYHQLYTGYGHQDNPTFLNDLKNTFDSESPNVLKTARDKVVEILLSDLPTIIKENKMQNCLVVCAPRAKRLETYSDSQLKFREAVKIAISEIPGIINGIDCIIRTEDTLTTHLRKATEDGRLSIANGGEMPYPGITMNTCRINNRRIRNQNIILIDDIYTNTVNVDEDCIQALYDNGARYVIFYAIGYTRRN